MYTLLKISRALVFGLTILLIPVAPWAKAQTSPQITVGPASKLEQGVLWHEVHLPGGDGTRTLWIYLPSNPPTGKIPCIFIAPAGSPCITGMALGTGDQPEHTPYVHHGFAVVAYSIDGNVPDQPSDDQFLSSLEAFRAADYGVSDELAAVTYALRTYPQIDKHRLYVVGHSSAGTIALLSAENDPRIAGCVAYAPVGDLASRLGQSAIDKMSAAIPDFQDMVSKASSLTHANRLHCPVFLFHADDDDNVPISNVKTFINKLRKTNKRVYYTSVPTGGHYNSMREQGIPDGIHWLKSLGN